MRQPHRRGTALTGDKSAADRFAASITLRQIRYFIAVAEAGRVTAAATMLGISPSVVTEAVAELEALAGLDLFQRHSRGLSMTFEGRRFLTHCRRILASVRDASHSLARSDSPIEGSFTLGTTITVSGYFLAPLLSRFRTMFPHITVRMIEEARQDVETRLKTGSCDIALLPVSNISDRERLQTHTMLHSARRLWLPPKHDLVEKPVVTLLDLVNEPYIQLASDDADAATASYWVKAGLEPKIVVRTQSVEAVRSLIAFRQGIAILPDLMYRPWSLEGNRVEVRNVAAAIPSIDTGIAWPRERALNGAARAFLDFCRADVDNLVGGPDLAGHPGPLHPIADRP